MNNQDEKYLAYQKYTNIVQALLMDYQFIEEGLKMYINLIYDIIRFSVNDDIAFKYTDSDIAKHALGKLIAKFEKLTNRDDLVKELKDLVKQRNIIAHQAYLLSVEQMEDVTHLDGQSDKLRILRERTKKTNAEINKELTRTKNIFERITRPPKGEPGQSGFEKPGKIEY